MIHPLMQLGFISENKGLGLIASEDIPKGTISFVQDPLDISIHISDKLLEDPRLKSHIEKYSFLNHKDEFVISWDA